MHAAMVAAAGVLLLACGWVFRRTLAPGTERRRAA
jgi:hypothetical protein